MIAGGDSCTRPKTFALLGRKGVMSTDSTGAPAAATRAATRFFWGWLLAATAMSVAGNVTHATMSAPRGTVALAAAAAVVPPAVLVGATHSVALLIKARRLGLTYWCALAMTVALAGCAFVLSFDALRDLAISLGFQPDRAWLWPVAIDVSIAQSTLALLTLAPVTRQQDAPACPAGSPAAQPERGSVGERPSPPEHPARPVPRSHRCSEPYRLAGGVRGGPGSRARGARIGRCAWGIRRR